MKLLAIDPGTYKSAYVLLDTDTYYILESGHYENLEVLYNVIGMQEHDFMVIEQIKSYGNVLGDSILDTCVWIGRFLQVNDTLIPYKLLPRKTVCNILCRNPNANDANIRQACIDFYAQEVCWEREGKDNKHKAIGLKKDPGPLYGFKKDMWQALGLGLAWIMEGRE